MARPRCREHPAGWFQFQPRTAPLTGANTWAGVHAMERNRFALLGFAGGLWDGHRPHSGDCRDRGTGTLE